MVRQRKPLAALMLSAVALLGVVACGGDGDEEEPLALETASMEMTEVNASGYHGEVVIVSTSGSRSVVTAVIGRDGEQQGDFPASIQAGTCEGLAGAEAEALDSFRGGYLSQEIRASLSSLRENEHAFVVYQSADRQVYVACAEID